MILKTENHSTVIGNHQVWGTTVPHTTLGASQYCRIVVQLVILMTLKCQAKLTLWSA